MNSQIAVSIQELKELWSILFPGVTGPDDPQWALWFLRHNANVVRHGIVELATKYRKLEGQMDPLYMRKFASSVMNRLSGQQTGRHGSDAEKSTIATQ